MPLSSELLLFLSLIFRLAGHGRISHYGGNHAEEKWYTPFDAHTIQLIELAQVSLSGTKSDTVQEDSRWLMYLSENGLSAVVKHGV
jgi:hypothetical protein